MSRVLIPMDLPLLRCRTTWAEVSRGDFPWRLMLSNKKEKGKTEKPPVAHSNSWYAGAPCRVVHLTPGQQRHPSFYLLPSLPTPPPPPSSSSSYLSHSRHFLRRYSKIRVCLFRINPPKTIWKSLARCNVGRTIPPPSSSTSVQQ